MGAGGKDACAGCITRTPYATLVAVIMCWAGVGVFCGTMYRFVSLLRSSARLYLMLDLQGGEPHSAVITRCVQAGQGAAMVSWEIV